MTYFETSHQMMDGQDGKFIGNSQLRPRDKAQRPWATADHPGCTRLQALISNPNSIETVGNHPSQGVPACPYEATPISLGRPGHARSMISTYEYLYFASFDPKRRKSKLQTVVFPKHLGFEMCATNSGRSYHFGRGTTEWFFLDKTLGP